MVYEIILQSLWLILPAYIANGCAALLGGGTPIDFGKNYKDGKRIFGDGKTWRGLILGILFGMIGGFSLSIAAKIITPTDYNFISFEKLDFTGFPIMIPIIFSISFGALFGDIFESFFNELSELYIKKNEILPIEKFNLQIRSGINTIQGFCEVILEHKIIDNKLSDNELSDFIEMMLESCKDIIISLEKYLKNSMK